MELINPFAGVAMDLGNTLQMNFVVDMNKLEGTGHYAVITRTYANGDVKVGDPIPQSEWTLYSSKNNYYQFSYGNIAAKEMTDVLYATIYDSEGNAISVDWEDSTRSYVMRSINNLLKTPYANLTAKKQKQVTMLVDVLNYGAAAQKNFHYNEADLANALLSEEMMGYASEEATSESILERDSAYCAGTTLNLESQIELRIVFKESALNDVAYAVVTHTKHSGGSVETRVEAKDFGPYGSTNLYVPVATLSGADGDQVVTCTLYDADDNVVTTVVESMSSYLARAKNGELAQMLLRLTKSAYAYFHA